MPTTSVHPHTPDAPARPAEPLLADLPRDQALGLRLITLARAAAAMHMAGRATAGASPLASTQAASLFREPRP